MTKIKKLSLLFIALSLFLSSAGLADLGPHGITYTIHNLSASQVETAWQSDETQICIFCHTPHSGSLDGPLWNRESPTTTYTHYNSASLSDTVKTLGVKRSVSKESLLCLSCHDGSIAVNSLLNQSHLGKPTMWDAYGDEYNPTIILLSASANPRIGASLADDQAVADLSDDHPISFPYGGVVSDKKGQFREVDDAETLGARFFGSDNRVECSSCHDPHVMYDTGYGGENTLAKEEYRPFLVTSNAGSKLCLACHIK